VEALRVSLEIFPTLGEFEQSQQIELDCKSLALFLAAIETEKLKTDPDVYSKSRLFSYKNLFERKKKKGSQLNLSLFSFFSSFSQRWKRQRRMPMIFAQF